MKLTLIRHAEVEERYIGKYNGHKDIALSSKGERQAYDLATHFKDKEFDMVYCSDLQRAKETLRPFKEAKSAIYTQKLREKSWGRHEGLSFDEITKTENFEYKNFTQWVEALDGERYQAYIQRVESFFKDEIFQGANNILLVTHAGVIRTFIAMVKGISFEQSFEYEIPYASYIIYEDGVLSLRNPLNC